MEATEENLAQQKQAQRLPEGDRVPPNDWRDKDIPQTLDDEAEDNRPDDDKEGDLYSFDYWMVTHA
jgi:hypothetical protein